MNPNVTVIKYNKGSSAESNSANNTYYKASSAVVTMSRPSGPPPPPPFEAADGEKIKPRETFGANAAALGSGRSASERAREKAREAGEQNLYETYEQFPMVVKDPTSARFAPQPAAPQPEFEEFEPPPHPPTYTNLLHPSAQGTAYFNPQPTTVLQKGKKKQWELVFQVEKKRLRIKGEPKSTFDVAGVCEGSKEAEILVADVASGNVKRFNSETQTLDVVFVGHGELAGLFRLTNIASPTAAVSSTATNTPTHAVLERVPCNQPELQGVELVLCTERVGTRNLVETARYRLPENTSNMGQSSSFVQLADGDILVTCGMETLYHTRRSVRGDFEPTFQNSIKFDTPILGLCLLDKANSSPVKAQDGSISHDIAISFENRSLVVCNAKKDKRTQKLEWKMIFRAAFDPSAKRPFHPDLMLFDQRSETLLVHNHVGETSVELFRVLYNETLHSYEVRRLAHIGRLPQPRDFNARCWALVTSFPLPAVVLQKKGVAVTGELDSIVMFDKKQTAVKFFNICSEELKSGSS